jgi:hypothetical protein
VAKRNDDATTITIEVPDWAAKLHIRVFAGIELLAEKPPGGKLRIKVSRCNMCGRCCTIHGEPCEYLIPDGPDMMICSEGTSRPFACSASPGAARVLECTERFEDA